LGRQQAQKTPLGAGPSGAGESGAGRVKDGAG
jgi:hypothetical protein